MILKPIAKIFCPGAVTAGLSYIFNISTPQAMAVHCIGMCAVDQIGERVLERAFKSYPNADPGLFAKKAALLFVGHLSGQALAKTVCNVDVTARDVFYLNAATLGSVLVAVVISLPVTFAISAAALRIAPNPSKNGRDLP